MIKIVLKNTIIITLKKTIIITLTVLKNYIHNKKKMSILKIRDPSKRNQMVEEYLDLKKNIRDNLLSEKTGEQQLQTDLSKIFKPITDTQKAAAKEITEELKPIKEGIESLPQAITFPAHPSIEASNEKETFVEPYFIGDIAESYLRKFVSKEEADTTYGLKDRKGAFYIGNKPVVIKENNIVVEDEEYEGTPGLWELIVSKKQKDFTKEDYNSYAKLMVKTNVLHSGYNPENKKPRSSRSYKWTNILSDIWDNRKNYGGSGVIIISGDPNALLERLDLLLSSQEAGHTGVGNELVSICDELKRQGVLDLKTYKKLNSIIKNDST